MQKTDSGFWYSSDLEWYKPLFRHQSSLKNLTLKVLDPEILKGKPFISKNQCPLLAPYLGKCNCL